jgi:4a-hydroxytetrahydrobiopterin dehydratase
MERLPDSEVDERLNASAWTRQGDVIEREFERASFAAAFALVDAVAELAMEADHHPDILMHDYKWVRITLSTHSAGGITERDFALAAQIDALT